MSKTLKIVTCKRTKQELDGTRDPLGECGGKRRLNKNGKMIKEQSCNKFKKEIKIVLKQVKQGLAGQSNKAMKEPNNDKPEKKTIRRSNEGLLKGKRKVSLNPSLYRLIRNYMPQKAEWKAELIGQSYIDKDGKRKFVTRDDLTDEKRMKTLSSLLKPPRKLKSVIRHVKS